MAEGATETTLTTGDGFIITSDSGFTADEREHLKAKPIPAGSKPGAKADVEIDQTIHEEGGKTRGTEGRFRGSGKAKEEPEGEPEQDSKPAAAAKPDEKPKKEDKQDFTNRTATLAREKNAAREEAQREKSRAEAAEKRLAEIEAKANPQPAEKPKDGRPRLNDFDSVEAWEDARDKYDDERLEKKLAEREESRESERREHAKREDFRVRSDAAGKSIEKAGGPEFLKTVAPTMERIVAATEGYRDSGKQSPLSQLGEYVLRLGDQAAFAMQYLHENPEEVDVFEQIGLLPESRQGRETFGQLGVLTGTLKALSKAKARETTETTEPAINTFKPRANPPVPSVTGSPHIADPDLSNITDLREYFIASGMKPPGRR